MRIILSLFLIMAIEITPEQVGKLAVGLLPANCLYLHKGPCLENWIANFWHGFKFGMKFYFPLNFLPLVIKYKQVLKKPLESLKGALKGSVRSTMVLAIMALIGKITICSYGKIFGFLDPNLLKIGAVACTMASFIETPAKISEMAMYVMPRFFDALWKFLLRRKMVVDIPYGQVLIFALSLSALVYSHYNEPENVKPTYNKLCQKFFGEV